VVKGWATSTAGLQISLQNWSRV